MFGLEIQLRRSGRRGHRFTRGAENSGEVMRITAAAHRQIIGAVGSKPPENGMLLGGDLAEGVVRHVVFDDGAERSGSTYSPDHVRLNRLLADWWRPSGIRLLGFVHSHPGRFASPSGGDLRYAELILNTNPHLDRMLMPIVTIEPEPALHAFVVLRAHGGVVAKRATLEVLDEVLTTSQGSSSAAQSASLANTTPRAVREETFRRVVGAYDLARLRYCRVVIVGVGGASGFAEDLVRAGVHELVLVDPDIVSATNLTTQQVYRHDLGRPKVDAVADRLRDINPAVEIVALQRRFEDFSESDIESLLGFDVARPPIQTLLCGCTDHFFAQARVNRVGLQFGVPTLCAQVYEEGRGAEVTFTSPGVTPACHRCILRSRYDAYLNADYSNTVTSDGTPICSTTRLNSTKLFVAMALLHHGTAHARWGAMLGRIANRNLIQLRLDPDLALPVFDRVLCGERERIFADEAVWLPQQPEGAATGRVPCPDCGGTGDLRAAICTITDTRLLQPSEPSQSVLLEKESS